MKWNPKLANSKPLIPGWYRAHIKAAEQHKSKAGKESLRIKWGVDHDGNIRSIDEYLNLEVPFHAKRFIKILELTGCEHIMELEEFNPHDLEGKGLDVEIATEPESNGFPARDKVVDYSAHTGPMEAKIDDEDVPF